MPKGAHILFARGRRHHRVAVEQSDNCLAPLAGDGSRVPQVRIGYGKMAGSRIAIVQTHEAIDDRLASNRIAAAEQGRAIFERPCATRGPFDDRPHRAVNAQPQGYCRSSGLKIAWFSAPEPWRQGPA